MKNLNFDAFFDFLRKFANSKTIVYLFFISWVFTLILFFGCKYLQWIGLYDLVRLIQQYSSIIYLVTIVTSIIVVGMGLEKLLSYCKELCLEQQKKKKLIRMLKTLSWEEKEIVLGYVLLGKSTLSLQIMDGVTLGLERKGIIFPAIDAVNLKGIPYNISHWVWERLSDEKFFSKYFSEEDVERFNNSKTDPESLSFMRVNPFV